MSTAEVHDKVWYGLHREQTKAQVSSQIIIIIIFLTVAECRLYFEHETCQCEQELASKWRQNYYSPS